MNNFDKIEFETKQAMAELSEFFSLDPGEIEECHLSTEIVKGKTTILADLTLRDSHDPCPHCDSKDTKIHGYSWQKVNYSILNGRSCHVRLRQRRYRCKNCGRTFTQYNPFVFKRNRISRECVLNILNDLRKPEETFTSVGRRYCLSPTTVVRIFDSHVQLGRLPLPEYLSIDENYCIRDGRSKFACILVDFRTQEAVDVLPNRFKSDLIRYFQSIPMEEREKVKAIGIDMYPNYKAAIEATFPPSTKVVIDRFHLVKEFNTQADSIRLKTQNRIYHEKNKLYQDMKALKARDDFLSQSIQEDFLQINEKYQNLNNAYYLLKKFNWLLAKRRSDPILDANQTKKYNHQFKTYLNYLDLQLKIFELVPSLKDCYALREGLTDLYTCTSPEEAAEFFEFLYEKMKSSPHEPMRHFAGTMKKWKKEILNSLTVVDQVVEVQKDGSVEIRDRRLHNGVIERKNKTIKILKNVANGYTNFNRFRTRALYVLRPHAPIADRPRYESKSIRQVKEE